MELLEGLCSKVEVYELMGRSTQDTETEVSPDMDKMTWQRADPDNMAHKVNVRIGLVSPKPASSLPSARPQLKSRALRGLRSAWRSRPTATTCWCAPPSPR